MFRTTSSDRSPRGLVTPLQLLKDRGARDRESGQATTEFALILIPLLMLVGGIIYFGIGLNYWLDMNRVANQGARWAAVDYWSPQCASTETACTASPAGCTAVLAAGSKARLQEVLRCSTDNPSTTVAICFPDNAVPADAKRGDPVKVKLTSPYRFWFVRSVGITLTAVATMRLEQNPDVVKQIAGGSGTC
jgi:Flp pilus assembly protein TadG